jgi:hypothetical protein
MTVLEALSLLRNGNVKVKRAGWGKKEYLESYSCDEITGVADIYDTPDYQDKRGEKCYYPGDAIRMAYDVLNDFCCDDWEIVSKPEGE